MPELSDYTFAAIGFFLGALSCFLIVEILFPIINKRRKPELIHWVSRHLRRENNFEKPYVLESKESFSHESQPASAAPMFKRRTRTTDSAGSITTLQGQLDQLTKGIILFNPPSVVTVGKSERVEVRIAKKPLIEILNNLKGSGKVRTDEIRVSDLMSARLTSDAFLINSLSSERQIIPDDEFSEWSWDVVPIKAGTQKLLLHVFICIVLSSTNESRDLPVYERNILVRSNFRYTINEFGTKNWQWIAGTILIPIAVYLWALLK